MPTEIGVIVGRFQVHELHAAHRRLIEQVTMAHKKVIVFLGVSPVAPSRRNPLDFKSREQMLRSRYPTITVLAISDTASDLVWSNELDARIREAEPFGEVTMYGSRDSFIKHYHGRFPTEELSTEIFVSGTEVRKEISSSLFNSSDFRAGAIYSSYNRFKHAYPTVDVAVVNKDKLLLCRKPHESLYRFIGGFVDPKDPSLEFTASREVREEADIEVGNITYIGSTRIEDWRYMREDDKIITSLFAADYIFGNIWPQDDISELRWFTIGEISKSIIEICHWHVFDLFNDYYVRLHTEKRSDTVEEKLSSDV